MNSLVKGNTKHHAPHGRRNLSLPLQWNVLYWNAEPELAEACVLAGLELERPAVRPDQTYWHREECSREGNLAGEYRAVKIKTGR
jgi:hypothetical protein